MILEKLLTEVPGPRTRELRDLIATYEARGVTYLADDFPVFWESAEGATVTDVDGNRYLDLTSAFGVANAGHTNPYVAAAVADQAVRLMHGMGDVHPTEIKAHLLAALAEVVPGDCDVTYLCGSGSEAIEFALKTAALATGRSRFVAYEGGYHGLSLGALEVTGIEKFRAPFASLVAERTTYLPYPGASAVALGAHEALRERLAAGDVAAVLVEPVQGRAGVVVPPAGFLAGLPGLCKQFGTLLIVDEIYTGFGRTGKTFACEHEGVVPDLMCVGKAIAGGIPLSATIGKRSVMDAWPASTGEALHTSTYLGNPVACAAALANLGELSRIDAPTRATELGKTLARALGALTKHAAVREVRGVGAMWAVVFADGEVANRVVRRALQKGVILLQSGPSGESITIAPPLVMETPQVLRAVTLMEAAIKDAS